MKAKKSPIKGHTHAHESMEGTKGESFTFNPLEFMGCCLEEEPAPISAKIQNFRSQMPTTPAVTETRHQPGQNFRVYSDMIVGDLILSFPQIHPYLEDLHPLGLMSPTLHLTTLEQFFLDFDLDLEKINRDLETIINNPH